MCVKRGHCHAEGRARSGAARRGHREVRRGRGADRDAAAGAGDRAGQRVPGGDRLGGRRLGQSDAEGVDAVVAADEGVVAETKRPAVSGAEAEAHRPCIAAGRSIASVQRGDCQVEWAPHRGARRCDDREVRRRPGAERAEAPRAVGGQGLAACVLGPVAAALDRHGVGRADQVCGGIQGNGLAAAIPAQPRRDVDVASGHRQVDGAGIQAAPSHGHVEGHGHVGADGDLGGAGRRRDAGDHGRLPLQVRIGRPLGDSPGAREAPATEAGLLPHLAVGQPGSGCRGRPSRGLHVPVAGCDGAAVAPHEPADIRGTVRSAGAVAGGDAASAGVVSHQPADEAIAAAHTRRAVAGGDGAARA